MPIELIPLASVYIMYLAPIYIASLNNLHISMLSNLHLSRIKIKIICNYIDWLIKFLFNGTSSVMDYQTIPVEEDQ